MSGWSKEAVEALIEEYRKHVCLYTVKSPLYHNRNARRDAEAKIARALREVRPNTDSSEVKAKINGLRTQFCNERNKMYKVKSGMSCEDLYKPSFMWYERLLFLADHIMPRGSKSNLDMSQISEDGSTASTDIDFEGGAIMSVDDYMLDDDGVLVGLGQESDDTDTPGPSTRRVTSQPPQKEGTSTRKRKRVSPEDQVLANASQILASMAPSVTATDSEEIFGNYIASELRQIKNKRLKLLTTQKLQNIRIEARIEEME